MQICFKNRITLENNELFLFSDIITCAGGEVEILHYFFKEEFSSNLYTILNIEIHVFF